MCAFKKLMPPSLFSGLEQGSANPVREGRGRARFSVLPGRKRFLRNMGSQVSAWLDRKPGLAVALEDWTWAPLVKSKSIQEGPLWNETTVVGGAFMFPVLQHVDNHMSLLQLNSLFRVFPRGVEPGIQRGKIYFNNTDMFPPLSSGLRRSSYPLWSITFPV